MYRTLGEIELRSGERVEAGVVEGPDTQWAERIEKLLAHKGDPWTWQNASALREETGIDAHFHVLHRDGRPLANILTSTLHGVGHYGHVWTEPADRRQGACTQLLAVVLSDFRARGGRALYLGTGYDSPAYHIYHHHGFRSIAPGSGLMTYFTESREACEAWYFASGPAEVCQIDWPVWPASVALTMGDWPGVVRCAPLKLIGRMNTEGPLLPLIRQERRRREAGEDDRPAALALVSRDTGAVLGLAAQGPHPLWPGVTLADVYCHGDWWDRAGELLAGVLAGAEGTVVAYADAACPAKQDVLLAAGMQQTAALGGRLRVGTGGDAGPEVRVFEKEGQ